MAVQQVPGGSSLRSGPQSAVAWLVLDAWRIVRKVVWSRHLFDVFKLLHGLVQWDSRLCATSALSAFQASGLSTWIFIPML